MPNLRIKELAQSQGFTQESLAFRSGVTVRTVQRLWQDRIPHPRMDIMLKIARTLNVSLQELYTEEGLRRATDDVQTPSFAT